MKGSINLLDRQSSLSSAQTQTKPTDTKRNKPIRSTRQTHAKKIDSSWTKLSNPKSVGNKQITSYIDSPERDLLDWKSWETKRATKTAIDRARSCEMKTSWELWAPCVLCSVWRRKQEAPMWRDEETKKERREIKNERRSSACEERKKEREKRKGVGFWCDSTSN